MARFLLAAGFVALWSSGFVGATLAADVGSASAILAWRYLVTAAVLLAVVAPRLRRLSARTVAQQAALGLCAHVAFLGGVFGAAGAGVDAGTTALVCALQPMLVIAMGRAFWGDRVTLRQLVGLGLGLVAVAVTVGGAGAGGGAAVLFPVVSVLGLSGAALLERRWRPTVDVAVGLAVQVTVSAAVFTAYAGLSGTLRQVSPTPPFFVALLWLVVLSGLGGYTAFVMCLRRFGASSTSTLLYLTPPVTALWAWAVFGQAPTVPQLGGLALGAASVALVTARVSGAARPAPAATVRAPETQSGP
ncbi:DMT family transporter [Mycolicibacterium palauense]|uniref:DMT family transporter n=1 Tax=Mycolicibacterium palauense TaxID=2034511 RepID=UPI000BFED696|nr:DMT family transporter [Mycolicibacterium palauense]